MMWIVTVKQTGDNKVRFGFKESADALQFIGVCMECGEEGTEITVKEAIIEED